MARRRQTNAISLFPFLAVLVCTMGALILLLLVTTRRIRNDLQRQTDVAASPAVVETVDELPPTAPGDASDGPTESDATSNADLGDETTIALDTDVEPSETFDRAAMLQQIADLKRDITLAEDQQLRLNVQIRQLQIELAEHEKRQAVWRQLQDELQERETDADALAAVLSDQKRLLAEAENELQDQQQLTRSGEKMLKERESALIRLRELAQQIAARSDAGTDQAIIEFSNSEGTRSVPIVVEVTEDGFQLRPTDVQISSGDMLGFPTSDNPLLSVVYAVNDHRNPDQLHRLPYVLLLVRPDGSLPFYTAQRTLNESNVHFGYELLSADQQIRFDPTDETEQRVAREALLSALKRRKDVYGMDMAKLKELRQQAERAAERRSQQRRSNFAAPEIPRERFSVGAGSPPPVSSLVGQWERPTGASDDDDPQDTSSVDRSGSSAPTLADSTTPDRNAESMADQLNRALSGDPFPQLVPNGTSGSSDEATAQSNSAPQFLSEGDLAAGTDFFGGPAHSEQSSGPKQSSPQSPDADASAAMDSDRISPPTGFGRSEQQSAELPRGTRTAETGEEHGDHQQPFEGSPFYSDMPADSAPAGRSTIPGSSTMAGGSGGTPGSAAGTAGDTAPASSPMSATNPPLASTAEGGSFAASGSTSQDFLSRFMQEVQREKEKHQPNPILLALLRHAEAEQTAADDRRIPQGEGPASADAGFPTAASGNPFETSTAEAGPALLLTLTADALQIHDQRSNHHHEVDLDQETIDRLVRRILLQVAAAESNERPVVRFRVTETMLGIQQRLSAELQKYSVRTDTVEVIDSAGPAAPNVGPQSKQAPAEPQQVLPPNRSARGLSL
ncbi:MAG: hypothetical protein Fues2KO_05720 [Fuerstiella sp.]